MPSLRAIPLVIGSTFLHLRPTLRTVNIPLLTSLRDVWHRLLVSSLSHLSNPHGSISHQSPAHRHLPEMPDYSENYGERHTMTDLTDRFELFLLGEGEKKIEEKVYSGEPPRCPTFSFLL